MLNNNDSTISQLTELGLSKEEAKIYLMLLENGSTYLELSRRTGINRTTVYRIIETLRAKSLVKVSLDESYGRRIEAAEPAVLENLLVDREVMLAKQRSILDEVVPTLKSLGQGKPESGYKVMTFEGVAGLKQMLWSELKTKGEICIFAAGVLDMLAGTRWAEKYRARELEKKFPHRALENPNAAHVLEQTKINYDEIYAVRYLDKKILDIRQELSIHDDIVSIYNWDTDRDEIKIGIEIHSQQYATFMKAIFETYWKQASPPQLAKQS